MSVVLFLYKDLKDDELWYVDTDSFKFECGHYFSGLHLCNSCCYGKKDYPDFEDIKTILSKEDYENLLAIDREINKLGYGLDKQPGKIARGKDLAKTAQAIIIDKLSSKENQKLHDSFIEEEKEKIMEDFNLSQEDVDYIYENASLKYYDRGIVSCVYSDKYDYGYEEINSMENIPDWLNNYIDYESYADDSIDGDNAIELPSGKIASLTN